MKKIFIRILLLIIITSASMIFYIIWDNHRFIVVKEEVSITDLPEELTGFRILQISDLHEKEFGSGNRRLINKINAVEYDIIVFTGDMLDNKETTAYDSFYTLIEGIENKEHALYVQGNTDPDNYIIKETIEKSDFIKGMEERGVRLLESLYTVSGTGAFIHFVDFELAIIKDPEQLARVEGVERTPIMHDEQYLNYREEQLDDLSALNDMGGSDLLIALNHYPISDQRTEHLRAHPLHTWHAFDLLLAGHYHGGQIRIPFVGPVFVPEPWYEPNSFFPPENRVKGLWEYAGVKQYVSAGLGSSSAISFLKFRLFNTPEINIIELTN